MTDQDSLQRFLFENVPLRIEIVRLQQTYQAISKNHPYPLEIKKLLGEALAATALLSATIKFAGKLTLQAQSNGPISLLLAQSDHEYHLRGLAKWTGDINQTTITDTFNDGHMGIIIAPDAGERYQGIVKLSPAGLAHSLEAYFAQSEQLPTAIYLASDEMSVVGILMQIIPSQADEHERNFYQKFFQQLHQLNAEKILNLSNSAIIEQLALENDISFMSDKSVQFHCDCTVERMERAIKVLGVQEAHDILKTNKYVAVTCEFCNKQHDFDKNDIERIFLEGDSGDTFTIKH